MTIEIMTNEDLTSAYKTLVEMVKNISNQLVGRAAKIQYNNSVLLLEQNIADLQTSIDNLTARIVVLEAFMEDGE